METNEWRKNLRMARMLHIIFLVAIFVYVDVLARLTYSTSATAINLQNPRVLLVLEVALGALALAAMAISFYIPRWIVSHAANASRRPLTMLVGHVVRVSFFQAVAIYGLILGLLGARWPVVIPFLGVSGIALLLTFPTAKM